MQTDTLAEGFFRALFRKPSDALSAVVALRHGRAACKAALRAHSLAGAETYPARTDFVAWLSGQAAAGRELCLVTAADQQVAEAVAERFGLFAEVIATGTGPNLKGEAKRDELMRRFGTEWSYAGDSSADLPVFAEARSVVLAGHRPRLAARVETLGVPIEAQFPRAAPALRDWVRALRLHQWAKNILIFIPLLLSGAFDQAGPTIMVALAFLLMSICASGTYLLNDLADLNADRAHHSKCDRPTASGRIPLASAFAVAVGSIAASIAIAFLLKPMLGLLLVAYVVTTLAYSLGLKRAPMLDVSILACLYTMRLVIGAVAADVRLSGWLAAFSLTFFLSLSLAKRRTELAKQSAGGSDRSGRGYRLTDAPLVLSLGISSGMVALLLMILFLVFSAFRSGNYHAPHLLLGGPLLTFMWLSRVWLKANRGELEDDPVIFAVKDRLSLFIGVLLAGSAFMAVVGRHFS